MGNGMRYAEYFEKTYKAPCGMLCKGINAIDGLHWHKEYGFATDNPFIVCPKGCVNCTMREEPLASEGTGVLKEWCVVHPTDEPYIYENSYEGERKMYDERIAREKISFSLSKNGHVCENHMRYNKETQSWEFNYHPTNCAQYCSHAGGICPVLGRKLTNEKGNVYFDFEIWGRDYTKDGTLFEGEQFHVVTKGIQLYDKPINLDIAKLIVKLEQDHIRFLGRYNRRELDHMKAFRAERGEIDYHWAVKNIRAEKKAVRDFEQDMQDIQDGLIVTHDFDEKRRRKEDKAKRIREAKEKRKKAIEGKILKSGWEEMDEKTKNAARKMLESKEIENLRKMHRKQEEEKKNAPTQMSMFDFVGE